MVSARRKTASPVASGAICELGASGKLLEFGRDAFGKKVVELTDAAEQRSPDERRLLLVGDGGIPEVEGRRCGEPVRSDLPAGEVLRLAVGLLGLEVHKAPNSMAEAWLSYQESIGHSLAAAAKGAERCNDGALEWQTRVLSHLSKHVAQGNACSSRALSVNARKGGSRGANSRSAAEGTFASYEVEDHPHCHDQERHHQPEGTRDEKDPWRSPQDYLEQVGLADFMLRRITRAVGLLQAPDQTDQPAVLREYTESMLLQVCQDLRQWLEQLATLISLYHVHILDLDACCSRLTAASEQHVRKLNQVDDERKEATQRHLVLKEEVTRQRMKQQACSMLGKELENDDPKIYSQAEMDAARKEWEQEHLEPLLEEIEDLQREKEELRSRLGPRKGNRKRRNSPSPEMNRSHIHAERDREEPEPEVHELPEFPVMTEFPQGALEKASVDTIANALNAVAKRIPEKLLKDAVNSLKASLRTGPVKLELVLTSIERLPLPLEVSSNNAVLPTEKQRQITAPTEKPVVSEEQIANLVSCLATVTGELNRLRKALRSTPGADKLCNVIGWAGETVESVKAKLERKKNRLAQKVKLMMNSRILGNQLKKSAVVHAVTQPEQTATQTNNAVSVVTVLRSPQTAEPAESEDKKAASSPIEERTGNSEGFPAGLQQQAIAAGSPIEGHSPSLAIVNPEGVVGRLETTDPQGDHSGDDPAEPSSAKNLLSSTTPETSAIDDDDALLEWAPAPTWDISWDITPLSNDIMIIPASPTASRTDIGVNTEVTELHMQDVIPREELEAQLNELRQELEGQLAAAKAAADKSKRKAEEEISRLRTECAKGEAAFKEMQTKMKEMRGILSNLPGGAAKQVAEAMRQSGLTTFFDGGVYDRLYKDALQRMRRLAEAQARIMEQTEGALMQVIRTNLEWTARRHAQLCRSDGNRHTRSIWGTSDRASGTFVSGSRQHLARPGTLGLRDTRSIPSARQDTPEIDTALAVTKLATPSTPPSVAPKSPLIMSHGSASMRTTSPNTGEVSRESSCARTTSPEAMLDGAPPGSRQRRSQVEHVVDDDRPSGPRHSFPQSLDLGHNIAPAMPPLEHQTSFSSDSNLGGTTSPKTPFLQVRRLGLSSELATFSPPPPARSPPMHCAGKESKSLEQSKSEPALRRALAPWQSGALWYGALGGARPDGLIITASGVTGGLPRYGALRAPGRLQPLAPSDPAGTAQGRQADAGMKLTSGDSQGESASPPACLRGQKVSVHDSAVD